ncbi:hypothetical protein H4R24_002952 [Coemansia sp. RSA 988]|nr:hypothetical protein H4R24_002952 [Coemansia sp. RSA 988]
MNISIGFLGVAFAYLLAGLAEAQSGCSNIVTRRDITSLSPQEWSRMTNVLNKMRADGWFEYYANIHNREFSNIHGNDNFFPWHRRFLRDFEEVGQRYDSTFAVPYWDELHDSRNPAGSVVLSSRFIGGNGFEGCVRDGLHAGWKLGFPNSHCLTRSFDLGGQMQSWYSPEYIYSIMQRYNDMHGFREHIEYSLHGSVHLGMGGDMGTYWSTNDFAFWLHHAYLDRLWDQWQSWGHASTMDGSNHNGNAMSLNSSLPHYGESAGSTVRLGVGRMCFQYAGGGTGGKSSRVLSLVSQPPNDAVWEADAGLNTLPERLRRKWFPLHASRVSSTTESAPINDTESTESVSRSIGKPLPFPAPLTDKWVLMHRFDRQTVSRIMAEAKQFVTDINGARYLSPY